MYPHIEQMAEVCAEEAERFLIEGFELSPWYSGRLKAALEGTRVRACFLGHSLPYVDVAALGFEAAMQQARHHLIRRD